MLEILRENQYPRGTGELQQLNITLGKEMRSLA